MVAAQQRRLPYERLVALDRRLRLDGLGLGIGTMRVLGIVALGIATVVWSALPTHAAKADCNDATSAYNSRQISDLSDAIRRYTRCLSSSNGHDDCSSEFRKVKNAQSDFESAVSQYESECN
jgi:hypothetical protein